MHRFAVTTATLSTVLAFALLDAAPAAAQRSTTRGLNLGVHLQAASLSVEGGEADGGGGVGFRVGYGFNRLFTLYLEADGVQVDSEGSETFQGSWSLGHADLGVRFHFASALRSWVPYLEAAVGARSASVDNAQVEGEDAGNVSFTGGSFSFGGGLSVYLTETLALDVGLKFTSGEFNEINIGALSISNLDIDAKSTRFQVGLVWWP